MAENTGTGMEYALGFVLKLAEAGVTFDEAEAFSQKRAQALQQTGQYGYGPGFGSGWLFEPKMSKRTSDRIYRKTRKKIIRENIRAQKGSYAPMFQGFRDPITGKLRLPFSIGARKANVANSTMTPSQANLVSLLTKHRKMRNYTDVARKLRNGSADFEFMRDPTVFNSHTNRFTPKGLSDLRKAYSHVHGYDPGDQLASEFAGRLFGDASGFGGSPFVYDRIQPRRI